MVTEIFWWMLFFLIAGLSLIPVVGIIRQDLLLVNGALAVIFSACFRYSIFFNKVVYFKPVGVKELLLLANIVFFFYLLNGVLDFLALFDNHDISFFTAENNTVTSADKILIIYHFFKKEFLFFSVGTLILLFFLELLLIGGILERVKKIE